MTAVRSADNVDGMEVACRTKIREAPKRLSSSHGDLANRFSG